jgi:hypothetical protein
MVAYRGLAEGLVEEIARAAFLMSKRDPKPTEAEFVLMIGPRLGSVLCDARVEEVRRTTSAVITERIRELEREKLGFEAEIRRNPIVDLR